MQPPSETAGTTPTRTTPTDTITWVDGTIELVDQTVLPQQEVVLRIAAVPELVAAIRRLSVRGAPALGVAGAYGVALALATVAPEALDEAIEAIRTARPTAVNLARMTDRVAARVPDGFAAVLAEAHAILTYLCNRHGWTDLYPDAPEARARVDREQHERAGQVRRVDAPLGAGRELELQLRAVRRRAHDRVVGALAADAVRPA